MSLVNNLKAAISDAGAMKHAVRAETGISARVH